jgi:hypothetical protein
MTAFSRFEERGGAIAKLRIHVSALIERRRRGGRVTLANGLEKLIVQCLFRISGRLLKKQRKQRK